MPERPALLGIGLSKEGSNAFEPKRAKRSSPTPSLNIGTSLPVRALTSLGCTRFPSGPLRKLFEISTKLSKLFGPEDQKVWVFPSSRRSIDRRIPSVSMVQLSLKLGTLSSLSSELFEPKRRSTAELVGRSFRLQFRE
jgi:hypothetical protein